MSLLGRLHQRLVYSKRIDSLCAAFETRLPADARVLDVGCGDGRLSSEIMRRRPDLNIEGVDVLLRPNPHMPIRQFDGTTLPYPDRSFDVAMFVDVIHHAEEPLRLLQEAMRVAPLLLIKDHLREGLLANQTLRIMDWVGNARHGVRLPYRYWARDEWLDLFSRLGLTVEEIDEEIVLYGPLLHPIFGRSLHFLARLAKP
ncbi:MAG: class I SAM-dependent methyltransferase [Thermoanaerobaculia bacterium]